MHDVKAKPHLELYVLYVANCLPNCQSKNKETLVNFKGLSQDGGQAEIAENLCASFFNEDLSNDTTFI
jgi:hypothetical protein